MEFVYFPLLLASLFFVPSIMLGRFTWPEETVQRRFFVVTLALANIAFALFTAKFFEDSSVELITTTSAWCYFAFASFWCIASKAYAPGRIAVFVALVVTLLKIYPNDSEFFATESIRHRWLITCVAGWLAGLACRMLGWRIGLDEPKTKAVDSTRAWKFVGLLLVGMVICLVAQQQVAWHYTSIFNRDFSVAVLGCLYAVFLLASLSTIACRFPYPKHATYLAAGATLWAVFAITELRWFDRFAANEFRVGDWVQYLPWVTLGCAWWWLLWKHLTDLGFAMEDTGDSLLKQPKLKHMMVAMLFVCFLTASVKHRYFDGIEETVKEQIQLSGGEVEVEEFGSNGERIVSVTIREPGSTEILKQLRALRYLRSAWFSCELTEEDVDRISNATRLRELTLENCWPIPSPGSNKLFPVAKLGRLTNLETLDVRNTLLDPTQSDVFESMPKLKTLRIDDPLELSSTKCFPHVTLVDFSLPPQDPRYRWTPRMKGVHGFVAVPSDDHFPSLEVLQLHGVHFADVDAIKIRRFANLKELQLRECQGLEQIAHLDLPKLHIEQCDITKEQLKTILDWDSLQTYSINANLVGSNLEDELAEFIELANDARCKLLQLGNDNNEGDANQGFRRPFPSYPQKTFAFDGQSTHIRGFTIQFDDYLKLLKLGDCQLDRGHESTATQVMRGSKMIRRSRRYPGILLEKTTDEELAMLLDQVDSFPSLFLHEPMLSDESWKRLANRKLNRLTVYWNKSNLAALETTKHFRNTQIANLQFTGVSFSHAEELSIDHELPCKFVCGPGNVYPLD